MGKRFVRINLNDYMRVRITPAGLDLYDAYYREAKMEPPPIRHDADGWHRIQAWQMAAIFGPGMYNGAEPPVEMVAEMEVESEEPANL